MLVDPICMLLNTWSSKELGQTVPLGLSYREIQINKVIINKLSVYSCITEARLSFTFGGVCHRVMCRRVHITGVQPLSLTQQHQIGTLI